MTKLLYLSRFDRIEWKYLSYGKNLNAARLLDILEHYFPEKEAVIDIGCGSGGLSHYFDRYIGAEIDLRALQKAKESQCSKQHYFVCCDAEFLPFKVGSVPLFISISMLEHTQDPGNIVKEISRIASFRGAFILPCRDTIPFFYDPINFLRLRANRQPYSMGAFGYGHINVLTKRQWQQLIEQEGFRIDAVLPYDNSLLTQIEFLLFSLFTTKSKHYSYLPVKTVSRRIYLLFNILHKVLSFFDIRTKKSFAQCFIVSKSQTYSNVAYKLS